MGQALEALKYSGRYSQQGQGAVFWEYTTRSREYLYISTATSWSILRGRPL